MAMIMSDWGATPFAQPEVDTIENEFAWGRKELSIVYGATISASCVDAGSSPTTLLRSGLVLGIITSSGLWTNYSSTATDGSQIARGVLATPALRTADLITGTTHTLAAAVIVGGPVQAGLLYGLDAMARVDMFGRFIFDDDLTGNRFPFKAVTVPASIVAQGGPSSYQVTAADSGTLFTTTGATGGAVTFTLPATIVKGSNFRFVNTVGQNMVVTAPSGKFILFNNAAATSATFSTPGNLIGACLDVVTDETGSKYIGLPIGANTLTVS